MKIIELSQLEINEWYAKAVGEIGIPPSEFFNMTTEELEIAYEGYLQKLENFANLILLALNKTQTPYRKEVIKFIPDKGYDIGNLKERDDTFQKLGIKEGVE